MKRRPLPDWAHLLALTAKQTTINLMQEASQVALHPDDRQAALKVYGEASVIKMVLDQLLEPEVNSNGNGNGNS